MFIKCLFLMNTDVHIHQEAIKVKQNCSRCCLLHCLIYEQVELCDLIDCQIGEKEVTIKYNLTSNKAHQGRGTKKLPAESFSMWTVGNTCWYEIKLWSIFTYLDLCQLEVRNYLHLSVLDTTNWFVCHIYTWPRFTIHEYIRYRRGFVDTIASCNDNII